MKLNTKILKGLSQSFFPSVSDTDEFYQNPTELLREISTRKLDGKDKGFIWIGHPNYIQGALKNKVMGDFGISISKNNKPIILNGIKTSSWNFVLDIAGDIIIEFNQLTATAIIEALTRTMGWIDETIKTNEKLISDIKSDLEFLRKK